MCVCVSVFVCVRQYIKFDNFLQYVYSIRYILSAVQREKKFGTKNCHILISKRALVTFLNLIFGWSRPNDKCWWWLPVTDAANSMNWWSSNLEVVKLAFKCVRVCVCVCVVVCGCLRLCAFVLSIKHRYVLTNSKSNMSQPSEASCTALKQHRCPYPQRLQLHAHRRLNVNVLICIVNYDYISWS
jgi:hypothetical protein